MRVTENTNYTNIRDHIQRSKDRMSTLQRQSTTAKRINHPSDDPIASAKVLELRTEKMNHEQFQWNSRVAETFLENTDHVLADLQETVLRVKELAIGQASASNSGEETRMAVAEEIMQLIRHAIATANRRVGDRYLLGGFKTQTPPFDPEGHYLGDDGQMMVEVAGHVFSTLNISGNEALNTHPPLSSAQSEEKGFLTLASENINLFDELQKVRISILTGDLEGVRNTLEPLDQLYSKLVSTRAKIGARLQGLQATSAAIERHTITNAALNSVLEDADMVQVVMELGKEEMIFRNALASSKRLIQPTLLDFLK